MQMTQVLSTTGDVSSLVGAAETYFLVRTGRSGCVVEEWREAGAALVLVPAAMLH